VRKKVKQFRYGQSISTKDLQVHEEVSISQAEPGGCALASLSTPTPKLISVENGDISTASNQPAVPATSESQTDDSLRAPSENAALDATFSLFLNHPSFDQWKVLLKFLLYLSSIWFGRAVGSS
jgi:hypothetical protein